MQEWHLFPNPPAAETTAEPRLNDMHRIHGRDDGHRCGQCAYLVHVGNGRRSYTKCSLNRISRCHATDWCKRWPACGKFSEGRR